MADLGQARCWDDSAQVQDSQYELLPAGEYDYEVTSFKRERFDGSAKMAACPIAVLQLKCTNAQASGTGFCRLFLNSKVLWRITQFFKSCGLLDPNTPEGTSFPMSLFEQATGCTGKVKVTVTKSTGSNGKTYYDLKYYSVDLDYDNIICCEHGLPCIPIAVTMSDGSALFDRSDQSRH